MDYQEPTELEVRDKTVGILRKALQPLLKDAIAKDDLQKFAEGFYDELKVIGARIDDVDKRIDANKPADVDMRPIALLMAEVTSLAKREIKNELHVELPEIKYLTERITSVMELLEANQQTIEKADRQPKLLPEVRIANMDEFKLKIPNSQAIFTSKFPFISPTGQGNTALKLMQTSSGMAMPVVLIDNPTSTGGGGGDASAANQTTQIGQLTSIIANQTNGSQVTTVSGVVSTSRTWILDQATDSIKTYPQGITTISGANRLPVTAFDSGGVWGAASSTTPLAGNAVFISPAIDVLDYNFIQILVYSDKNSATDGVEVQFSTDGTNWDDASTATYITGSGDNQGQSFIATIRAQYARVKYTNGNQAQTVFRFQTILMGGAMSGDIVPMGTAPNLNNHAQAVVAQIYAQSTAGGTQLVPIKGNPAGNLLIANDSVGVTGIAVPGSATYAGGRDAAGNLRGFETTPTGRLVTTISGVTTVSGTVGGTINVGNFPAAFGRSWTLASGVDSVGIANFPTIQTIQGIVGRSWVLDQATDSIKTYPQGVTTISGGVTLPVKDDYQGGEILPDQAGAGAVLTFSFSAPVQQLWVLNDDGTGTAVCRADPFGGTPSSSLGIPCYSQAAVPIVVNTNSVKVYAPSGCTVTVWGFRRTAP